MAFPRPPVPKSLLGRHRLLAPSASVRVSPLALGGMSLGSAWQAGFGECTKDMAFSYLDRFYELGGNFIDTANVYQGGESERWIGEWMEARGVRAEMVVSTKYGMNTAAGQDVVQSNFGGTGSKTMHDAIARSLSSLRTSYVDIYYVHAWDFATRIPELMHALNILVTQGKVLYLGISDTPAWVVAKANAYARQFGLRPFSIYQGRYSAQLRDLERDVLPMARDEGMAIHAFGVMAHGMFRAADAAPGDRKNPPPLIIGREGRVSTVLEAVAKRHAVPVTSVALAYVMQKTPYLFPIIGGRKIEQLEANVQALSLQLSQDDVREIETGYDFDLGFPHNFINLRGTMSIGPQDMTILQGMGYFDYVKPEGAIKPHSGDLGAQWQA